LPVIAEMRCLRRSKGRRRRRQLDSHFRHAGEGRDL